MNKGRIRPEDLDETTIENEELATHQENVPVPYVAGTRRVAVRWLDNALDYQTVQREDSPGKK